MEIRTQQLGDVLIADIAGRLDSRTAGPAATELNKLAQGGHGKLVLNVRELEYVSSAGLRAMLVAAKLAQARGGTLAICGANAAVAEVMEISGLARLLHLHATEEEALASVA
jgi:anti-sigma B factor antagonist